MKEPKLVVLTGYPGCGKTTLSNFLVKKMDFVLLSGDMIAIELFGHVYPFKEGENPELIWETVCRRRDELLKDGKSVVIDTTAYNNNRRADLLSTDVLADKYLVWLQVSPNILESRLSGRKWTQDSTEKWKLLVGWEDPNPSSGYILLLFKNDNQEDLELIEKMFE
jgi:predicted kinase